MIVWIMEKSARDKTPLFWNELVVLVSLQHQNHKTKRNRRDAKSGICLSVSGSNVEIPSGKKGDPKKHSDVEFGGIFGFDVTKKNTTTMSSSSMT